MTLTEYYDELAGHDWYYNYSDDYSVWQRGLRNKRRLVAIAQQSEKHMELLEGFQRHMFTGEPWGNKREPKPERPK